jgi:probable HAF family extracellular repeat protein
MRTRFTLISRCLAAAAAVSASPSALADVPAFDFTDLGTLGGAQSVVFDLNDNGQAVGWSLVPGSGFPHAFLWENGVMTDLGILAGDEQSVARAINNAGTIVGTSERDVVGGYGIFHAFIYDNGVMTALPGLGGEWSWASDINSGGQIAGFAENPSFQEKAVIWDGGGVINIGQYSSAQRQRGHGINDAGVVVGGEYTPLQGPGDAFAFDGTTWLVIGGTASPWQTAEAFDINNSNIVVGLSAFPSGDWRAAMWLPGNPTEPINLGTLPGYELGELYAVNDAGQAVGFATKFDPDQVCHAIYYDGVDLIDLNDCLPPGFDGYLWDAMGINAAGEIVATASTSQGWRAYLLTPAEPSDPADINGDGVVDVLDLLALLSAWGPCSGCPEDINGDGAVDVVDLLQLLASWS